MDLRKRLLSQLHKAKREPDPVLRDRMIEDAILDFDVRTRRRAKIAQAHAAYVAMCEGTDD